MPSAGILAAAALAAIGYLYVGKPVAHGVHKAGTAVVHVFKHSKKAATK